MDVVAHGLWAGVGTVAAARRWGGGSRGRIEASVTLAVLADGAHLLPILAWVGLGSGTWAAVLGYAMATPGTEPWLPEMVQFWSHTLHCVTHSAIVAALVTAAIRIWWRRALLPLLGWWSHIVIDVFTHSLDYYPSPVLWPLTERGFDGIAWPTPWFMVLNYCALALVGVWQVRHSSHRPG